MPIPVIDLFAGPGGLGEGFSAYPTPRGHPFKPVLSIEKELRAHQTLTLRSFFRQFRHSGEPVPSEYYKLLRGDISLNDLFAGGKFSDKVESAIESAKQEAQRIELGGEGSANDPSRVDDMIELALGGARKWLLLGGPPCQAYSLVGRFRMGGLDEADPRVKLYEQYLRILVEHEPSAFVFENVKGLASSKIKDRLIFREILDSLEAPGSYLERNTGFSISPGKGDVEYQLFGLEDIHREDGSPDLFGKAEQDLRAYVIRSEDHGIPQARHRIIIVGLRKDLIANIGGTIGIGPLDREGEVAVSEVIYDLPKLRSGLSKHHDGKAEWVQILKELPRLLPAHLLPLEMGKGKCTRELCPESGLYSRRCGPHREAGVVNSFGLGEFAAPMPTGGSWILSWMAPAIMQRAHT